MEKELKNLKENESKNEIIKLEQAFQSLSHISLNYHIKKFSSSILDMAEKLGKKVGFNVIGDEVSVSKEKLHILQDIFTHIFRNSIDHGIEFPQERINSDKDEEGFISVNIEKTDETYFNLVIRDDGKGFNLNDIKRKAIEKGLVTKDQAKKMHEEQILNFIFYPNFSTKEEVSELSGRGVGMDVVKNNLDQIDAKIMASPRKTNGAKFIIKLNQN